MSTLNNNLVASYPFNGNLNDASGNGYNLTGVNSPTFGAGKIGQAVYLSRSSNQYGKIAAGILKNGSAAFTAGLTIAAWIYPTSLPAQFDVHPVMASQDRYFGFGRGWMLGIGLDVTNWKRISFTGSATVSAPGDLVVNTWNFVAVRWLAGTAEIYLNSATPGNSGSVTWAATTSDPFNIGAASDNAYGVGTFDGRIDTPVIHDRALTNAEMTELFNGSNGLELPVIPVYEPNAAWQAEARESTYLSLPRATAYSSGYRPITWRADARA